MNPVYVSKFKVFSHNDFFDAVKIRLEAFWRFKCQDPDAIFHLVPDDDRTLDMFKERDFSDPDNPLVF